MNTELSPLEELDLVIPNMDSAAAEIAVKNALEGLPGVAFVRLVERGAFARYDANAITKDQICMTVRQAGYRADIFQDSKSGETGISSQ